MEAKKNLNSRRERIENGRTEEVRVEDREGGSEREGEGQEDASRIYEVVGR